MKKVKLEEIRQDILNNGKDFIQKLYVRSERGNPVFMDKGEEKLFENISRLVEKEDSPVRFKFEGETVNEKIDCLMQAVANGKLTPRQGQTMMDILRNGFEVGEISELKKLLEQSGIIQIEEKK